MNRPYLLNLDDNELVARIESRRLCFQLVQTGVDPDIWTPDHEPEATDSIGRASYEETARAACTGCEVILECLELALRRREKHFVFGGTAPWERERIIELSNPEPQPSVEAAEILAGHL